MLGVFFFFFFFYITGIDFFVLFFRFSVRVNNTDVFHVDRRFWTSFRSRFPATGPRERAFHTATVIGNYMVVYGENKQTLVYVIYFDKC